MQEVASAAEQSKAPETTPTWHQPTLTVLEAGDAESTVTNSGGDAGGFS
ncbi:hypothetical protein [Terriglobus albidus]|nr:hypothetical protein [Terriglobus albidus]